MNLPWPLIAATALGLVAGGWVVWRARRVLQGLHARRPRPGAEPAALGSEVLALVAEHTQALVCVTDAEGRAVWVNAAFERLTGYRLDDVRGRRPSAVLCPPQARAALRASVPAPGEGPEGLRTDCEVQARDGRRLWLDTDIRPMCDAAGRRSGWVLVATDISERVLGQRKLQLLWQALPAGVVVQAPDGQAVDANPAAMRLLGLDGHDLGDPLDRPAGWQLVGEGGQATTLSGGPGLQALRSGQALRDEVIGVRQAAGATRWLLANTEPLHDAAGSAPAGSLAGSITCFTDITATRELQHELREHARTDALTRLPNRSAVLDRIARALSHAERHPGYGFAVLFMDFDRFKQVNDTLGHAAGDALLCGIAERLQECLRPGDGLARVESSLPLAARLGGDEFVVVLDGVRHLGVLTQIADRLLESLAAPYIIQDTPVACTASIGIVLVGDAAQRDGLPVPQADELLRNADTAMYEAKRRGRGRWVVFDPAMRERVLQTLTVERELRLALERDELFVVYQPLVDLASGEPVGAEALVRWRHPVRGLVPPVEFVPVAEECGLIEPLGAFVLERAVGQWARWAAALGERAPHTLSVNLSRAQLERPGLATRVAEVLARHDLPAARLQLEVTESTAASHERMQQALRELKALGLRLGLDDFGTGYSSLACLHELPVDTVKIDRSFVRHAETVEYHRVLIEATIRVARTLGMSTVAEGIETPGQAALMHELRCTRGQGWLYGRPMEAEAFEAWLAQARPRAAEDTPPLWAETA